MVLRVFCVYFVFSPLFLVAQQQQERRGLGYRVGMFPLILTVLNRDDNRGY